MRWVHDTSTSGSLAPKSLRCRVWSAVCVDVRAIHPAPLAATKSRASRLQMVREAREKMPEGVKKNEIVADSPGGVAAAASIETAEVAIKSGA
jgi:hypothetical protein